MERTDLSQWKGQIIKYLYQLNNELIASEHIKKLYYGFEVIDGKLKVNPQILFIGINPGYGDETRHYTVKFDSERISYLDYFDNEYNYPLARETVKIFRLMNLSDDEIQEFLKKKCVKTNLYHISTYSKSELNNIKRFKPDFYHNSISFCLSLFKLIKPKVVIFEGKSIYNEIVRDIYEIKNSWDNINKIGLHFSKEDNIHFLGYERNRSNILNKEIIAKELKQILQR